jgi:hypothetical protein
MYIYVTDVKKLSDADKNIIKNNIQEAVKLLEGDFEVV